MFRIKSRRALALSIAFGSVIAAVFAVGSISTARPAVAEALLLIEADSGKVLRAENATYPWYPASTTKLMTLYMTLDAIRGHRITQDTLFAVSPVANAQAPTKMGFPVGTQVTVDNALKMMMVKSANDMAVLLAEGIAGSVDDFAQAMTDTAHRLGMTESSFVNPNGLPADGQIMSARDLAILARALIREFPEYSFYWHIPAIKFGRRVVRNYNPLIGRYPGADGMKTGFICASGFNLVATATRGDRQLIAVVLGAPSSGARAVKAAEMLEVGFTQNPLSWLTPSLGTVDALAAIDAAPPNLKDEMCGRHRKRPATEEDDADAPSDADSAQGGSESTPQFSVLLSALRAPTPKNLLADAGPVTPIVVYTGPTRSAAQLAALPQDVEDDPIKKKAKHRPGAAKADHAKTANAGEEKSARSASAKAGKSDEKPAVEKKPGEKKAGSAKPADGKAKKPTADLTPRQPTSATALAAGQPPQLKADAAPQGAGSSAAPKPPAAKPATAANFPQ